MLPQSYFMMLAQSQGHITTSPVAGLLMDSTMAQMRKHTQNLETPAYPFSFNDEVLESGEYQLDDGRACHESQEVASY
jgi:hypothetical protein